MLLREKNEGSVSSMSISTTSKSSDSDPRVDIIILNWNGWRDTIECLESIARSNYSNYRIVVVDNGSSDNSIERIKEWAKGDLFIESRYYQRSDSRESVSIIFYDKKTAENGGNPETEKGLLPGNKKKVVLIQADENLGFAGGCNLGIRYSIANGSQYIWLLNNDTVIDSSALYESIKFMEGYPDIDGITGQIRLYNNPSRIWNCGGKLTFYGARRYNYSGEHISKVPQSGFRKISFITGCAPIFRTSLFKQIGPLSNLFFYGEEDFELSLRLKKFKRKIVCLYNAIIYHKVGSSIKKASDCRNMSLSYIYYLNRFIDMRYFWPRIIWNIWRYGYFFYIFPLMKMLYGTSWRDLWLLRRALLKDSSRLNRVSKDKFEQTLRFGFNSDLEKP